jgi:hypothetical protein
MKTISKPNIKVKTVFTDCISSVANTILKQELTKCNVILEVGEQDF